MGGGASDAQVAASVDHGVLRAMPLEDVDGTVYRVALGDAAQIDPQGAVKVHLPVVDEFNVAPGCGGVGGRAFRAEAMAR